MPTELLFGSTMASVMWILAVGIVASVIVGGLSMRSDAERGVIIDRLLKVWLIAALAAVVVLTLQPGPNGFGQARPAKLDPTAHLDRPDALANLLLYVPLGLFAALLWRTTSQFVLRATGLAFAVSFVIELAQRLLPIDRAASAHDVIFNTLGGFLGAVLGALVVRSAHVFVGPLRRNPR